MRVDIYFVSRYLICSYIIVIVCLVHSVLPSNA